QPPGRDRRRQGLDVARYVRRLDRAELHGRDLQEQSSFAVFPAGRRSKSLEPGRARRSGPVQGRSRPPRQGSRRQECEGEGSSGRGRQEDKIQDRCEEEDGCKEKGSCKEKDGREEEDSCKEEGGLKEEGREEERRHQEERRCEEKVGLGKKIPWPGARTPGLSRWQGAGRSPNCEQQ